MTGLQMALKAFGIQIPEESIRQIEELLPKIPTLLNQGVQGINNAYHNFDIRLRALEDKALAQEQLSLKIITMLEAQHDGLTGSHHKQPARRITNGRA